MIYQDDSGKITMEFSDPLNDAPTIKERNNQNYKEVVLNKQQSSLIFDQLSDCNKRYLCVVGWCPTHTETCINLLKAIDYI